MRHEIGEVLGELEARGEISAAQRERIHGALSARLDAPRDHGGRVIAVVATFGALLFAAGILYLVAINWEALGKAAKLGLVFGAWAGLHALGYALAERPGGSPRIGSALTLAGMLCFGGAIYLVAQVYHLSAREPWAILWWCALNVPLMLWLRSRAAQAIVTGLFLLWAFLHAEAWYGQQVLLSHSWHYEADCMLFLGGGLAALLGALALLAPQLGGERYRGLWRALALPGALLLGYVAGFGEYADGSQEFEPELVALTPALCALGLALALLFVALARGARGPMRTEALALLVFVGLLDGACLAGREILPIVANLLELAALLALVWHGTRTRSAALVNLALACFALLIVSRYLEYLWDKLEGAYAFLGSGALLLALGWFLERRRRSLMLRVRGGAA